LSVTWNGPTGALAGDAPQTAGTFRMRVTVTLPTDAWAVLRALIWTTLAAGTVAGAT